MYYLGYKARTGEKQPFLSKSRSQNSVLPRIQFHPYRKEFARTLKCGTLGRVNTGICILVAGGLAAITMGSAVSAQTPNRTISNGKTCSVPREEIEVYAALFDGDRSSILSSMTESRDYQIDSMNLQLAAHGLGLPSEARADFTLKNRSTCEIKPFPGFPKSHLIASTDENAIFKVGWGEFHKRYGKESSIMSVSRVGFNSDKTLALLHMYSACGHNCFAGTMYILERKDGKWVIKISFQTAAV
jgi:hypothetical protein